jgi:homoserine/homoserine lactone efflux protein
MPLSTWLAFFVACWLISLSPGAGAIKSMNTGMRYGYRKGLYNILGLQLGVCFLISVVATGLGALLAASVWAFDCIKWLGVGYLVWLGLSQWRAEVKAFEVEPEHRTSSRKLVVEGLLVNASNPKGIIFMLAVLPHFIDPSRPQLPQYLVCGATLVFTDLVVMSGYTMLAARVLHALREPHHVKWMNRVFGSLFVAAGVLLGSFRRTV